MVASSPEILTKVKQVKALLSQSCINLYIIFEANLNIIFEAEQDSESAIGRNQQERED